MNQRDFHLNRMKSFLRGRLAEEAYQSGEVFRPSLTISRQCGSGADRIGQRLVEYLDEADESATHGWALFDQSLIGRVIEDHKLPDTVGPYLAKNAKFSAVQALEESLNLDPSKWTLFNYTSKTIRLLCTLGNAIIVGRAGNYVSADLANTFHVRLVGSIPMRKQRIQARHLVSSLESEKLINETDLSRSKFVKRYTHSEIEDPSAYHLTINTDDMDDNTITSILADSLLEWAHEKESHSTREASSPTNAS
tara:strand:- start:2532 stop:3284 length:753 start_codon:yes stop_codon:yes gene_type:complete